MLAPSDLELLAGSGAFRQFSFNARERHCLFVNDGGRRFVEAGYALGVDADLEGRGVAIGDLNLDGRLDVVVRSVARQKLTYFRNDLVTPGHFLRIDLQGTRSNRDAVGATVRLAAGGASQMRVKAAGSGFQGQSEATLQFGLGSRERVDTLSIRWPSGLEERFAGIPGDRQSTSSKAKADGPSRFARKP